MIPQRGARPFALSGRVKAGAVLLLLYTLYAGAQLDFSWNRFETGLGHASTFLARMFPPNFEKPATLWKGIAESLEIAVLASVLGIACALPVGLLGARNLMPAWVSWPARALVALCRALHPVIVAILFVKAVGFGALAGILALTVASIGFIGKLFTEAIEEISLKQVEAVRATGASFGNVLIFGVLPQVFARASSASPPISSIPTCATPPWWASSARAGSAARCSRPSSALTTTSSAPSC